VDLKNGFVRAVRAALGLSLKTTLPKLDRMAYYRSRVDKASSDGKTLDITPLNADIPPPRQAVQLRTLAGVTAIVQPGAIVGYGWDEGDESKPHCIPLWDAGAALTKFLVTADVVILGAESGAQFVALANKVDDLLTALRSAITAGKTAVVPQDGGLAAFTALDAALKPPIISYVWPTSVAALQTKAK
jgi:hypothetical protein